MAVLYGSSIARFSQTWTVEDAERNSAGVAYYQRNGGQPGGQADQRCDERRHLVNQPAGRYGSGVALAGAGVAAAG